MAGLPVSPVNAWNYTSRHNPHDSGPKRIALSISYRTFIDYLLPVCPGASRTTRSFSPRPLSLPQVARLLWAAQGISSRDGDRTAPSAGALYPLELQLVVGNVEGLPSGSYRYDAMNHTLEAMVPEDLRRTIAEAALHQGWIAQAPAIVIVSAVESRTTRKYGTRGVRYVHMEVGHASQNLLLQAVALGLSGSVVGAFDDERLKRLLQLLVEERPLAILPVGYGRSK